MFLSYYVKKLAYNLGMLGGNVFVLMQVSCEIVETWNAFDDNQFPVTAAHSYLVGFMELPV